VVYKYVKLSTNFIRTGKPAQNSHSIWETLQSVIGAFAKVFAVVDALDECPDETRTELFEELRSLANINLLVSVTASCRNCTGTSSALVLVGVQGKCEENGGGSCAVSEVGTGGGLGCIR